jgi:NADH-quinone oxidoreductase subunit N
VTAFMAAATKTVALVVALRVLVTAFPTNADLWTVAVAVIAVWSLVVGNFAALVQRNVKRMLAYSSIGHAGYVLLGILSLNALGLRGVLLYTLVYVFANLGIWATVLMLRRHEYAGERVDDFEGLHRRAPFWAFAMVMFLLSLGGIPPTAGFIGKYFLFAAAIQAGFGWLAIIAVLMSAVSMFFYLRIVVAMYLKEGKEAEVAITPPLKFVAAICLAVTLIFGIAPSPLVEQVTRSSNWVAARAAILPHAGR